jgi:hypothetical protein
MWRSLLSWFGVLDLRRRYRRMEAEEQASLQRAERIRTGDLLDDLTTLGGD